MRIIGYVRVSTGEQAVSGAGLEAQRATLEQACASRGFELVRVVEDAGASGKTLTRPGLEEALAMVRDGVADGLMVAKLDRLSRSVVDFNNLLAVARKQGWKVIVLDADVDTSTPMGEAMANMVAVFAQLERRMIGQRTKDALVAVKARTPEQLAALNEQRVALGKEPKKVIGRPRVIDDELRARVHASRSRGVSFSRIASELALEGVPTAHGGQWHASTIAGLIR